jgi:choline dehydrogenase-like flavoprotein
MADQPYDLVILGAGQAGCTLAGKIAEHGVNPTTGEPLRIALLDRGPYFKGKPNPGYGHPVRRQMFTNVSLDFRGKYVTRGGLPPGESRKVALKAGEDASRQGVAHVFGGGTIHYTAVTAVPYEVDYGVWVDETGTDWSYQNVKPFADQINRDFNIHVRPDVLITPLDHLFRDTAQSMGYPAVDATIAKQNCLLTGYCDGTNHCKYDARQGSFVAYLPIAEERGVEMMPECNVERVLFEKSGAQVRVKGVEYTQNGERHTLEASRVAVSCGTYFTPVVLYNSGYGPRELTVGTPIVENRNVGANTDNRPQVPGPIGIFDEPVSDGEFHHTGAYYIFHDTNPDGRYERIQIDIRPNQVPDPDRIALNSAAPEFGREHKRFMREVTRADKMTPARKEFARQARSTLRLVRPRNIRGYINEWSEQIFRRNEPSIIKPLEQGRELIYEVLKKMGAKEILGMDRPIRNPYLATFVGSCIGGADPKTSVVDPYFESHDIDGLFVCCGSTVPRAASQGYAGSVATLALFAAHRIVERHFKRG